MRVVLRRDLFALGHAVSAYCVHKMATSAVNLALNRRRRLDHPRGLKLARQACATQGCPTGAPEPGRQGTRRRGQSIRVMPSAVTATVSALRKEEDADPEDIQLIHVAPAPIQSEEDDAAHNRPTRTQIQIHAQLTAAGHRHRRTLSVILCGVVAKVLVLETTDDSAEMQDAAETLLPARVMTGPLFVGPASATLLDQDEQSTNDAREVEALQRYLRKFGYTCPSARWTATTATTPSRRWRTCRAQRVT